ncbi:hypothetical protein ACJJH9_21000 [Microbulbifer sp. DLAB2-AF]|uniref:hypothetical protein n=1 Tax=Microbulbifer sp. DLAB2-AF TaxID=3243395 RepID=UPI0040398914
MHWVFKAIYAGCCRIYIFKVSLAALWQRVDAPAGYKERDTACAANGGVIALSDQY